MPAGLLFGIIDNGVVGSLSTFLGWVCRKLFPNWDIQNSFMGGVYACLAANACSDWLGAMMDHGTRSMAGMIFLGCLIPIPFVYLWRKLNE